MPGKPFNFILKDNRGLTVIELVIVIVIIGIIAAIGSAKYIDLSNAAKTSVCKANQQNLMSAQRFYWISVSVDPGDAHYAASIDELAPFMKDNVIPDCPVNGTYQILPDGIITCTLPDHKI